MLATQALNSLQDWGCCPRCTLIFLGERSEILYSDISVILESLEPAALRLQQRAEESETADTVKKENGNTLQSGGENLEKALDVESEAKLIEIAEDNSESTENSICDHVAKKHKSAVCITCLGLLQWGCSTDAVKKLSEAVITRGHVGDPFSLALALPICLSLRVHRVWTHLLQAMPQYPTKGRIDHLGIIKDVWKSLVGPAIETSVERKFINGSYLDFILNVSISYENDLEECKIIEELCSSMFAVRRQQHRKYAQGVFSKQSVEAAIKKVSDAEFLMACPEPPSIPSEAVVFQNLQCQLAPVFMAGRYNKYSRELPQTPWFVDGERKMESSVQELICETLNDVLKADDLRFSSSGREDVDVRCLGTGRPFVVEFVNPCLTKLSRSEVKELQSQINKKTNLVHLRDLQIVDRKEVKNLKEGEEEKTKAYCALCLAKDGYDPKVLNKLTEMTELTINQKTPLRVLHRRTLATRQRIIHKMTTSCVDDHFFKLHLTTQAGTYIKEFVHGDFGRTEPNLGMLLDLEVDIIALDVENVALDWPPKCDD